MKMKVAVIGLKGLPAFGGAATVGENIIMELSEKYDFTVYSVSSHASPEHVNNHFNQIVFSKSLLSKINVFMYYWKSALHAVFLKQYDLVHLHHIDGAYILPLIRLKYRVILTAHARPQLAEKWPWYAKLLFTLSEWIAIKLSNEFTCVSKSLQDYLSKKYSYKRFHYISNGTRNEFDLNDSYKQKDYILFTAGRIIPVKGLHLLLKSLRKLQFKGLLIVIGNLDHVDSYKKKVLKMAQGLNVKFIGLIKEKNVLFNYLKEAKVFVFPSYSENMSMVLLEAATTGTPIVCSDIQENKDIFGNNEVLYFKSGNIDDLANKIEFAITHPKDMKTRANEAYKKLEEEFLWESIAPKYANLFDSLLQS